MGSRVKTGGGGGGGGQGYIGKAEEGGPLEEGVEGGVGRRGGGAERAVLSAVVFVWSPFKDKPNCFTIPSPRRHEAGFTACCPAPLPPSDPRRTLQTIAHRLWQNGGHPLGGRSSSKDCVTPRKSQNVPFGLFVFVFVSGSVRSRLLWAKASKWWWAQAEGFLSC